MVVIATCCCSNLEKELIVASCNHAVLIKIYVYDCLVQIVSDIGYQSNSIIVACLQTIAIMQQRYDMFIMFCTAWLIWFAIWIAKRKIN